MLPFSQELPEPQSSSVRMPVSTKTHLFNMSPENNWSPPMATMRKMNVRSIIMSIRVGMASKTVEIRRFKERIDVIVRRGRRTLRLLSPFRENPPLELPCKYGK